MMADVNLLALLGSVVVTAIASYVVQRMARGADLDGQARAALIGIGPQIIAAQDKRIHDLEKKTDELWLREQECIRKLLIAERRISQLEQKLT